MSNDTSKFIFEKPVELASGVMVAKGNPWDNMPKCVCGAHLFKWMGKDASHHNKPPKTSDPYAWCRNPKCPQYGTEQAPTSPTQAPSEAKPKAPKKQKPKAEAKAQEAVVEAVNEVAASPKEPEAWTKARRRIRETIETVDGAKAIIGLALTILAQEIGSKEAANHLIDEFALTAKFGIKKVEENLP